MHSSWWELIYWNFPYVPLSCVQSVTILGLFIPLFLFPCFVPPTPDMASNLPFSPHAQPFTYLNRFDDLQPFETRGCMFFSFMNYDTKNDHTILDPYIKSTPAPAVFTECFPRHYQEVLLINKSHIHAHAWLTSNHRFNSYPSFDKKFFQWYWHMKSVMEPHWQLARIDKALMFCYIFIDPIEYGLIGSLCNFWSPS